MFDQTFVDGTQKTKKPYTILLSLLMQVGLIGIAILIPLPANYGSTSLANNGWWKISYTIPSGVQANDTTTWKVSVRGNPVHLVVP